MEYSQQKAASDFENEIIAYVKKHVDQWKLAECYVTEKVVFQMRPLIRQLRKNYWGIFDTPKEGNRDKIWPPLTESMVEAAVKNIDLDTKDINLRAKTPDSTGLSSLARNIVHNWLSDIGFGDKLDLAERQLSIDGTIVWKTLEKRVNGRETADVRLVDLLNFYIDPTASCIAETNVVERSLMSPEDVKGMDWINTKDIVGKANLPRVDADQLFTMRPNQEMVDVYEFWGEAPKYFKTKDEKDKDEYIPMRIVVSGIETTDMRVHVVKENTKKDPMGVPLKPYEECWYTRIPGRWYGKGVAEKLMMLQLYLNIIVNIRIGRSYLTQLGLFKMKKGTGITQQMLSRFKENGIIPVNSMDDIEQMVVQEASQASYTDEQNIQTWAQRVTSAFESATGEQLPSSTPATNAVLQSQASQSQFVLIKEQVGLFLQRWLKRQAMPILAKNVKLGDVVRYTEESEVLRQLDEKYVDTLLAEKLDEMNEIGLYADPMQVMMERERLLAQRRSGGKDRFAKMKKEMEWDDWDVEVYVTNEEIDKSVLVNNLMTVLQTVQDPSIRDQVLRQIYDLMGLDSNTLTVQNVAQLAGPQGAKQQGTGQPQTAPQGATVQSPQNLATQAMTMA